MMLSKCCGASVTKRAQCNGCLRDCETVGCAAVPRELLIEAAEQVEEDLEIHRRSNSRQMRTNEVEYYQQRDKDEDARLTDLARRLREEAAK